MYHFFILVTMMMAGQPGFTSKKIDYNGTAAQCVSMETSVPQSMLSGSNGMTVTAKCMPADEQAVLALNEYRFNPTNRYNVPPPLMDAAPVRPRPQDVP